MTRRSLITSTSKDAMTPQLKDSWKSADCCIEWKWIPCWQYLIRAFCHASWLVCTQDQVDHCPAENQFNLRSNRTGGLKKKNFTSQRLVGSSGDWFPFSLVCLVGASKESTRTPLVAPSPWSPSFLWCLWGKRRHLETKANSTHWSFQSFGLKNCLQIGSKRLAGCSGAWFLFLL